jgi:hypothetical protein
LFAQSFQRDSVGDVEHASSIAAPNHTCDADALTVHFGIHINDPNLICAAWVLALGMLLGV